MEPPRFVRAVEAARVPQGHSLPVDVEGVGYALFHTPEGFFAITNRCPHQGAPLAGCPMIDATRIRCALHGWIFQLDPAKPGGKGDQLDRPATRLVDGWVEIEAPDQDC